MTMLTGFWEAVGTKLADRWFAVSVPALVFAAGGLLAWLFGPGTISELHRAGTRLGQQPAALQVAILVGTLLGIVASGALVAALTMPALRFLEGYWPPLLDPLHRRLVRRTRTRVAALDARFQALAGRVAAGAASSDERSEYVRLDRALRRFPANGAYQPTRLGNTLRAAESRPVDKYGLDAVAVWPHLWVLLPAETQKELASARSSLDTAVGTCLWGVLFVAFSPFAWWALLVGPGVALLAYELWMRSRAEAFADLVEAVFDLYRGALYAHLRWPLPANPRAERSAGQRVTMYLWRGLDEDDPTFTPSDATRPR